MNKQNRSNKGKGFQKSKSKGSNSFAKKSPKAPARPQAPSMGGASVMNQFRPAGVSPSMPVPTMGM